MVGVEWMSWAHNKRRTKNMYAIQRHFTCIVLDFMNEISVQWLELPHFFFRLHKISKWDASWHLCPPSSSTARFKSFQGKNVVLLNVHTALAIPTNDHTERERKRARKRERIVEGWNLNREKIARSQTMEMQRAQRLASCNDWKWLAPMKEWRIFLFYSLDGGGAWDSTQPKRKFMQIYLWLSFIELAWVRGRTFRVHILRVSLARWTIEIACICASCAYVCLRPLDFVIYINEHWTTLSSWVQNSLPENVQKHPEFIDFSDVKILLISFCLTWTLASFQKNQPIRALHSQTQTLGRNYETTKINSQQL